MFITFLVILFSDLSFADASIQGLMQWYNYHPFAFILAIQDIILGALVLFRIFNQFISIDEDSFEPDADDSSDWIICSNIKDNDRQ